MPNSKAPRKPSKPSQGKAPEMDNGAKTSGYEQPAVATTRNLHQDKAVDRDANEPPGEPRRRPKVPRAAKSKAVDGDTKKPPAEPQRGPESRREGYERSVAATNMSPHKDNTVDGDTKKSPAEPQASPKILRKAQDYEQPTAATNMSPHKDNAIDSDIKKPLAEPQVSPEILREAQGFITKLNMGLIRILGTLFVTLAPLLSTLLVLFFLFNILRAAFESACKIPSVPYISYAYCQSSDDRIQRLNSLENLQSRLVHVQQIGASRLTLPIQLEYSKNVVREVAGIVDHSKVPSRDKIVNHLTDFWQLTDNTIDGIGDFLQAIDRMVDSAITRNEITLRNLKNIALKRTESAIIVSQVIAVLFHTSLTAENAIRRQYLEHLDKLMAEIDRLLPDSHLQDNNLKRMANIQWEIHNVIVGDNNYVTEQEHDVQGKFWAQFGGYKNLLDDYKQQAAALQQLDVQRKWAVDLTSDIAGKLKELKSKLGDLRYRIQEPGLDLSSDLDFQIAIIQKSLDNLYAGRVKSLNEGQKRIADIKKVIEG